jgi:uncharacterized BrkB/YihY/UPF0761 family membrane protein
MTEQTEQKRPNLWERMKARWGVSTWGVIAILLAFSLAGSTVLKVTRPILDFVLPEDVPRWLWWTARIVIIVPVYQVLLMMYGTLLGQFRFFWEKEKKMAGWIARPFSRHS